MRGSAAACAGLAAALALGACDAIVGAGNRKLDTSIVCTDDGCTCAAGFGDCDGEADNGCETDLNDSDSCGECGNVCENGKCQDLVCVCAGAFAECDGDPLTVCETDVSTSPDHCGSCGRSCLGAPCEAGRCVPQPVGNVAEVYSFILLGKTLYLAPNDLPGIHRMSSDGGPLQKIGADTVYAYALAAGGTSIYWTSANDVRGTTILTGETVVLAAPTKTWQGMAVGGGKVYWGEIDGSPGTMRLKRTSLVPDGMIEDVAVLGDGVYQHDFVATSEHVYWNEVETIVRSPHDAVTKTPFLTAPTVPTYLALTSDALLFAGIISGTYLAPLDGGATRQLANVPGYGPITADETHVYFATYADKDVPVVWRVSKAGGEPPVKLAEDPYMVFRGFAVDDEWLYWIGGLSQAIVRIAK